MYGVVSIYTVQACKSRLRVGVQSAQLVRRVDSVYLTPKVDSSTASFADLDQCLFRRTGLPCPCQPPFAILQRCVLEDSCQHNLPDFAEKGVPVSMHFLPAMIAFSSAKTVPLRNHQYARSTEEDQRGGKNIGPENPFMLQGPVLILPCLSILFIRLLSSPFLPVSAYYVHHFLREALSYLASRPSSM